MADLADQIDDYICSFEGVGDLTMDTLAMLIFAWAVLGLFLLWLCKYLYKKYVKKGDTSTDATGSKLPVGSDTDKLRKSEPKDILASKEVKELASKASAKGVVKSSPKTGGGGSGGGGWVPSTPTQLRKRLSRKSPGPELRKSRTITPPSNVVGPDTVSVTWTSQIFRWLYTDLVIVNELLHSWVQSMNEYSKKSVEEHGVAVEIVRVLPESLPPGITNIFCNSVETNPSDLTITWDCETTPVLQVKAFRQKAGKVETSHYKATVSRFRGRVSTNINYNTLKGEMKTEGYPEVRISLNSIGPIKGDNTDETQLQEVVSEIIIHALRNTVFPIDFSVYSTCPRAVEMEPPTIPVNYPIHYDSLANNMEHLNPMSSFSPIGAAVSSGKRLLVKVVKGDGLKHATDPYCVVEMDEPPQKNQTGARQGISPYWDEHFLFELSPQSAEILFEIYDRPVLAGDPPRFLGLGLVGIDELSVGPSSSQILALQPRPYETEAVSGAITVEFVFIEGAEIPAGRRPYKLKEALKINAGEMNGHGTNGTDLVDSAMKAIEGGALYTSGNPSKSTLIIHSVQRDFNRPFLKVALNDDGQIQLDDSLMSAATADTPNSSIMANFGSPIALESPCDSIEVNHELETNPIEVEVNGLQNESTPGEPRAQSSPHRTSYTNGNGSTLQDMPITPPISPTDDLERGRTKRKSRDFFGTIKRRLGRSKTRTKSMDRSMIPIDADNPHGELRSVSADRGALMNNLNNQSNSSTGPRLIVPTLDQSRRSSLSESSAISGLSSASTKTYLHEASTLVLETMENGVKRHFLVPMAIAQRPRWRRKGTKLHIYNDHTFVAKHLSGGLMCDVCHRSIPRRPGKQGYECRDCLSKCHKQCHVRAPQACPNPTVLSIELSKLNSAAADRSIRKL